MEKVKIIIQGIVFFFGLYAFAVTVFCLGGAPCR